MKFKSKILCILLLSVLIFSLSAVAANENTTQSFKEVSADPVSVSVETNDEILGISNSEESLGAPDDGTFKTLQEKINTAEGDTLVLENNYTNTDNFNRNGIFISKPLTIDGNGYTIDALENGRIFGVRASNVTLRNINFVNGYFNYEAGAIYWSGDGGVLENCSFVNCSVGIPGQNSGGAIYWYGDGGVLGNCSFVNCSAYTGGAVYFWGSNSFFALNNCSFVNCFGDVRGGGVYSYRSGVLGNCSFVNCSTRGIEGGAVYLSIGSFSPFVLGNCSFVNCSAGSRGGAVSLTGFGVLGNCSFVDCSANAGGAVYWNGADGTLSGCSFVDCSAGSGGAVFWNGADGVLDNCSFVNCFAPSGAGGAVYWSANNGILGYCSFENCSASYRSGYDYGPGAGGAVYWFGADGVLVNCNFIYCSSWRNGGGAVYWRGPRGVLGNSSFVNCSTQHGGALYWFGADGVLVNCSFENCYATTTGGYGGAVYWQGSDGKLDNCNFIYSRTSHYGGAVYWHGNSGILGNCSFSYCSAPSGYGGAIYWHGSDGKLDNCNFIYCSSFYNGGAVYWHGDRGILGNCSFVNFKSATSSNAGAVCWIGAFGVLVNCSFENCSSNTVGGAIFWEGINGTVKGSTFVNCSTTIYHSGYVFGGGAVYWFGADGVLVNCSFSYCSFTTSNKRGGAVYWSGDRGILGNCSFVDCSADEGGAVYWSGADGVLVNCSFSYCSFTTSNKRGGAVYWHGDRGILGNSSFVNCSAGSGGAVSWSSDNGTVSDCSFVNCSANYGGGAVSWSSDNGTVSDCSFVNCSAGSGGAVSWSSDNGTVSDCSFVNCSANGYGGAVSWTGGNGVLGNCSFENCSTVIYYYSSASCYGSGAVSWTGGNGVLGNCSFVNCFAVINVYSSASCYGSGAVSWTGGNGVLGNCSFVNCFAIINLYGSAGSRWRNGGGAVYWSGVNGVLGNSSFVNCSLSSISKGVYWTGGGAVSWSGAGGVLGNSSFVNCSLSNCSYYDGGGAVHWHFSDNSVLSNCSFVNCSANGDGGSGGAVHWYYSDNSVLSNCSFVNCSANGDGGAVGWDYSDNSVLGNCSFVNCSAGSRGGAVYWDGGSVQSPNAGVVLGNCSFVNCSAGSNGGAVGWMGAGDNGVLGNCSFVNCSAYYFGGAVHCTIGNAVLGNCSFVNCSAVTYSGGAVGWCSDNSVLANCSFVNCSAVTYSDGYGSYNGGGAIYLFYTHYAVLGNCSFVNCSANGYGGAVYWYDYGTGVLGNCSFVNCSARHSGAIYVRYVTLTVNNSNFNSNYATHGGGAIGNNGARANSINNVVIKNSKFKNNYANNYGGALSLEHVSVDNSTFDNNSAVFGGAIYSISPTVKNSKFKNNKASELGNSIFAINKTTIENSNINNNDIYENNLTESIIYNYSGSKPYNITYGSKTYDAFSVESNLIIPLGWTNDVYIVDSSFKLVRNVLDSSDVSEYVKSLLYKYFKGELSYDDVSAMIDDAVYGNPGFNMGDNAPDVEYIGNNMVNVYEYISLITPSSNTNLVFIKQSTHTLNYTVTKEALDKTAYVGDIVKFRINVTNGNNFTLSDVFVKDIFNDTEFEYLSFESKDNWSYDVNSKVFTLKSLSPSTTSSLILAFKVKINGTLTNIAVSGIGENETGNNNTTITVYNPQLAVEKTCLNLNQTVILGQTAKFEIYVRNDGDIDLHNVTITENPSQGLVFDSYDENGLWEYSFVNNKHVWTLVNTLTPGSSAQLFVNFKTTALGRLVNYADVVSSETNKSTTAAHVDVIKAEFKVEKIVLTPKVALGEQVIYEIIVHNTGEADLTNIVVEEMPDASLVFDHYDDKGLFKHSVELGKHIWTLDKLAKGTYAEFKLYFNTTALGNISNKISVKSDEVPEEIITSNNTTVLLPAFTLEKISLTPTVVLGQNALFEIVIRNTGKVELTNVYFTEDSFDGLIYDSAVGEGIWTHKFENDKHTWTFNDVLEPGEIIELTLRFNTTASGEFTNFVSAGSNQTEILTANATVNVLKPEFKVEKILLTPKVALGEQVIYEIVIRNTGEADLTNIVVEEMPDASLVFDHYVDGGLFKHSVELGKHIWTLDKLNKDNYAGFRLYFNTTATGNISNKISVKSDEVPEEIITSNNTTVLLSAFSVEKICLLPNVLVGNQTQFQIVIKNTGKIQLTDVYFTEESFNGLIYDSAIGEGIWTHKFENGKHTWTFNDVLEPGEIIGLTLIFNTTAKGNFTNFVSASSNQTEVLTANATVHVFESKVPEPPVQNLTGMDVFKTVITQEAVLGGQITFQIVVHNTGNTNLENVKISEILPEGLVYDHFTDYLGLWRYNNDLTWSATRAILPGEYAGFFVTFNTTKAGRFENHIVVSGDNTNITPGNTSFDVLNPSFTIEKILVEDYILNGTRATFEIVIHNTGNASLSGVTVKEYGFNGLIYSHFADYLGMWTYNGDLSWTLNAKLAPGEYAVLSVTFNTTTPGNFTNFVSGSSNETGILIANATVHVLDNKTGPEQNSSDDYKMDVFKTVITQETVLGGQITFQIVVHNTGNKNLENVKVSEILPDGLIYEYFTDYLGLWTYDGDLTWSATRAIVPGEYVGFFVTFNTTKAGRFENHIVVTADKGNATTGNSSFEVLNPDFTIEKILVEDNIANGGQATFEIVIHNTGSAPLTNLTVREYFFEGLVYNHFTDYLDLWTYNGDLTWTMNAKLLPGEYAGFYVTFNTTKDGKFTNIVVANSTECGDKFSNNATVSVHNETVDIRMVCLNPLVIVDNQVTFEITVQNTGNIPITALKISEYDFEGLIYDHYIDYLGHWINDGITWTLNTTLVPGEVTSLFVVFNTTRVGNFTNIVLANNDVLNPNDLLSANSLEDGIFVSAGVEVVKPEYTIEIVAINKTVENGEEVTFEVIVHNIGKVDVSNITVRDIPSDGLNYVDFIDNENFWSKNNDLSWDLVKVLVPGQYSSFYIVFNTTKSGILENTIVSDNLTSKDSVEVKEPPVPANPGLTINVEVTTDPITGQPVLKVTVTNIGNVDLDNVFVKANLPEGLKYGNYYSYDSIWNFNNDEFTLEGLLKASESKSFFIEILGEPGDYQIKIDAGYNGTIADIAIAYVKVLDNSTPGNNVTPEVPKDNNVKKLKSSVAIGNNATGNPLLMVLLVLFALGVTRFRKKD